jgi:hypothetical protein
MASNITLAVGNGTRRIIYSELVSARRLARPHRWPDQVGNDGVLHHEVARLRGELIELRVSEQMAKRVAIEAVDRRKEADGLRAEPEVLMASDLRHLLTAGVAVVAVMIWPADGAA